MSDSAFWDPSRFWQTLTYFEAIPGMSWLRQIMQEEEEQSAVAWSAPNVIVVVGAMSPVGQSVVRQLSDRGQPIRAIVSDPTASQRLLGDRPQWVTADLTQSTLPPELLQNVQSLLCIPTSDQIVGIRQLLHTLTEAAATAHRERVLFDFADMTPNSPAYSLWGALDDVVMGGVSESGMRSQSDSALFAGTVSTANSGGFASVRTRNLEPALDLSGYEGISLRVKGDGQRYKVFLRDDAGWDSIAYAHSFDTEADTWIDVRVPFQTLTPVFRAKTRPDAPPLNTDQIRSIQLMLSKFEYDGALNPHFTAGPFTLEIAAIGAYGGVVRSQVVLVRDASPELDAVADELQSSGLPYTIIRRSSELRTDDVAKLCLQALEAPELSNVTLIV